jgi:hypothetical protein
MADYFSKDVEVFNPKKCMAYPSANSKNSGQLNSEENIRWIMLRLTRRSFTLTPDDFMLTNSSTDSSKFVIKSGNANIDGYHFNCTVDTEVSLTDYFQGEDLHLIDSVTSKSDAKSFYVKFKKNVDAADHLLTYTEDLTTGTMSNFSGITIIITNKPPTSDELYLGTLKVGLGSNNKPHIYAIENNIYKCMFINSSNIYADVDELGNEDRTIINLISYLIRIAMGGGIQSDLVSYGPKDGNGDGTTNLMLTKYHIVNGNKEPMSYVRLYYNPTTEKGGIGIIDNLFQLTYSQITNSVDILDFDLTDRSKPIMHIYPFGLSVNSTGMLTIDKNLTLNGALNISGAITSTGGGIDVKNGNVNVDGVITANKVFGAVWS